MSEELKPCTFGELKVGKYFKWGNKVYSKIRTRYTANSKPRNAIGFIVEELHPKCTPRDSVWECTFRDDMEIEPFDIMFTPARQSPDIEGAIEEIDVMINNFNITEWLSISARKSITDSLNTIKNKLQGS